MADDRFGPWRPLSLDEARAELAGCPAPWWFTGGLALELFAGTSWRAHDDLDIGIRRCDATTVLDHLRARGWEVVVAAAGVLAPWDGEALHEDRHQNNVWCRRPGGPWQLDVTIGEGDDERWVYRRDRGIARPWPQAVREVDGVRFLAPELQLLFKSKDVRPKDSIDAEQVIPLLDGGGLALLVAQFRAGHPWLDLARRHAPECGPADVLHVLDLLAGAGVDAWVDGGWAVDALLGEQTRPHADLDLAVARADFETAGQALDAAGFVPVRDDGRHYQVIADATGRSVDVHAFDATVVTVDPDGTRRCAGDGLAYEADGFGGIGRIAGRAVPCISPATLVRYHTGYEVDADDWHDVRLLCESFDLPVPADYDAFR
jgi:lincosamide nucleotidyltransferase A/C/D/E